ncbi:MAG TPA: S41 family peptidase [Pyrinomonadaceae bacterium]|jgi:carboxyl-terminal processing protease
MMKFLRSPKLLRAAMFYVIASISFALFAALSVGAQTTKQAAIGDYERQSGREMLRAVKADIEKYYYDASYHGIDIEARFKEAEEKIKKATSNGQIYGIIAQILLDFDDSHLAFLPPRRAAKVEYGWQMQIIGERCYVIAVKPGSDAEAKGLKPGDKVISVDGYEPTRDILWKMQYSYYSLRPRPGMRVIAQSPGGEPRQLDVLAKITDGKKVIDFLQGNQSDANDYFRELDNEARLDRHRFSEFGDELIVWKMPGFNLYDEKDVDEIMSKVKKHKALILDLRGNGGGYVVMLKRLLGYFFDKDIKIADVKYRKKVEEEIAKTRGTGGFKGKIIVLVDSRSGSAAEMFARVIQLEKRGIVLGDRSAGAVMQSVVYGHTVGMESIVPYGVNITNADVIMTDGKSLEKTGVTPDEVMLPTATEMATNRDPVLARAAELLGFKLDAEKAGALFPIEWTK